jgi:hypothetical protein
MRFDGRADAASGYASCGSRLVIRGAFCESWKGSNLGLMRVMLRVAVDRRIYKKAHEVEPVGRKPPDPAPLGRDYAEASARRGWDCCEGGHLGVCLAALDARDLALVSAGDGSGELLLGELAGAALP